MKWLFTSLLALLLSVQSLEAHACAIPTGLGVNNITNTSAVLSWNAVAGALHYEIEVENEANTPQYSLETSTTSTMLTITGLVANGNYVFKVKSECEPGSSDYTPWFAFSTTGGGGSDSCAAPTGLAVTNVTATSAVLSWNAAAGALHYQVEVENGANTPQYAYDTLTATTTVTVTGLVANGNYVFKVKSECEPGSSDYTPWFTFNTTGGGGGSDSCAAPTGLAVTNVTATSAVLLWNAAAGALHYQVEVENGVNTPQYAYDTLTATTTVTVTGLVANGNYVFKVKSECEPGSSDYTPWFAFNTTGGGGGTDSCAVPTGLAVTNVTATGVVLSWNAVAGALHYQVEVENGANTPQYAYDTLTATTTVTVTGLVANGNYVFKVKSECEPGSSDYTPWFAFSTVVNGLSEANGFPVPDFALYPNPANSEVWLRFDDQENKEWRVRIFNGVGRVEQELNYMGSGGEAIRMPVNDLSPGVYSIMASNPQGSRSKQLIVIK